MKLLGDMVLYHDPRMGETSPAIVFSLESQQQQPYNLDLVILGSTTGGAAFIRRAVPPESDGVHQAHWRERVPFDQRARHLSWVASSECTLSMLAKMLCVSRSNAGEYYFDPDSKLMYHHTPTDRWFAAPLA